MTIACMCAEFLLFRECEHTKAVEAEVLVEEFIAEHLEEVRQLAAILDVPGHRAGHVLYQAQQEGYSV